MDKIYNSLLVESFFQKKFNQKDRNILQSITETSKQYCIMMPPPNVTGTLHMGHAFQQIIMDTLIRYHDLLNYNTLLQIGTDHAGIATQIMVEKKLLDKEGKNKLDYTKEEFINKIWIWKEKTERNILNQIKKLGISADWTDVRFTLDKKFSHAVNIVFKKMYLDKLIYQKKKMVYWDPQLKTVVSDLEVEHKESDSIMWYIKYFLVDSLETNEKKEKKYLEIATTRPETLLGDTALAVHPDDIRYQKYIGKFVCVPIINRIIPIISDISVNLKLGTGCLKVTPAHDFNDYEISKRHKLYVINIFSETGKILKKLEIFNYKGKLSSFFSSKIPRLFQEKDRFIVRKLLVDMLKKKYFLSKIEKNKNFVPYGDRSGILLEPKLTNQWFLRTKKLSKIAINMVKKKKIVFVPSQYKNLFLSWMVNIEDWCISRQLWWGHRIPVWYDKFNNIYVDSDEEKIRKKYGFKKNFYLFQDPNVLDTWFSSSLWTFAGLGWPKITKKFKYFHPTNVLISGFDIIFFWIARMIMMTGYLIKDPISNNSCVPFKTVYITGLICDELGKKMSKSKGNILDPLDMIYGISLQKLIKKRTQNLLKTKMVQDIAKKTIQKFPFGIEAYGIDALRLTFLSLSSTSRYIHWDMNRLKGYKHFCNKLWNVSRFIKLQIDKKYMKILKKKYIFSILDKWIFFKLTNLIKKYHENFKQFRFDLLINLLYDFVWYQFCDKYIENLKYFFSLNYSIQKYYFLNNSIKLLKFILILLNPIIPFITQYIWNDMYNFLKNFSKKKKIVHFKKINCVILYQKSFEFIEWFHKIISELRKIRVKYHYTYNYLFTIYIKNFSLDKKIFINENYVFLKNIAHLKKIIFLKKIKVLKNFLFFVIDQIEVYVVLSLKNYLKYQSFKIDMQIIEIKKKIKKLKLQLCNTQFLLYAPKHIISEKKKLLQQYTQIKNKLYIQKK
ncbi:valine--tRNA ligase [Buchnera aphidicola]|uniref:Valine--tRNA ligase n=1 Tax=Buchnera aphidicola subsp. Tuberolachnus salignus TaxID=98804 RepID=A0A160SW14_BUCTT|nr:valine--tRNA ligase [Buchnera aphidicola]CUR53217.1 Valine--tRNA ligase [Buchnera aphidicola (Tuberolachnus salignus)]